MNIMEEMSQWEQYQIEQYIKRHIRSQYEDTGVDKKVIFNRAMEYFNLPNQELYQARLDATIDQLLDSDWFYSYIEEQQKLTT